MTLESDAKFQQKLTCGLENVMRIWKIFTRTLGKVKRKILI